MRYFLYLLAYIPIQLLTYLITPLLPLFAVIRYGKLDNANAEGMGYRLPLFLSWFDTPDNSLDGDSNFINKNILYPRYLRHLMWLYRNSLYGFKWSGMSMPVQNYWAATGNLKINYHTKEFGSFSIKQPNGAWQYKLVKPFLGKILVLNFGWLLDDHSQKRALFLFSPRLKKIG